MTTGPRGSSPPAIDLAPRATLHRRSYPSTTTTRRVAWIEAARALVTVRNLAPAPDAVLSARKIAGSPSRAARARTRLSRGRDDGRRPDRWRAASHRFGGRCAGRAPPGGHRPARARRASSRLRAALGKLASPSGTARAPADCSSAVRAALHGRLASGPQRDVLVDLLRRGPWSPRRSSADRPRPRDGDGHSRSRVASRTSPYEPTATGRSYPTCSRQRFPTTRTRAGCWRALRESWKRETTSPATPAAASSSRGSRQCGARSGCWIRRRRPFALSAADPSAIEAGLSPLNFAITPPGLEPFSTRPAGSRKRPRRSASPTPKYRQNVFGPSSLKRCPAWPRRGPGGRVRFASCVPPKWRALRPSC